MENKDFDKDKHSSVFQKAFRLAKTPILVSFILTPVRFLLEFVGLPESAIFLLGLLWLTLAFSVYWGIKLHKSKSAYSILATSLIIFSPISRLTVVAAWWVDLHWNLGTHYGMYFETWPQALLNQLIYGALVQIIPGLIVGFITIAIMRKRNSPAKSLQ